MDSTDSVFKQRSFYEAAFVLTVSILFGIGVGFLGGLEVKFQVALALGLSGLVAFSFVPYKRASCLFLWVLIQPLSIEKIVYTSPGLWEGLRGQEIIINAGDIILLALAFFVIVDNLKKKQALFVWDKKTKLFFLLLLWGALSYLIHLLFFHSEYVNSAPLGLLHMLRNLLFVLIIQSAIQTRADLIWVLLSVLVNVTLQSALVSLSFFTHEVYNFGRLLGGPVISQSYSGTGETITRAVGTLGVANQQGLFHAMFTFLLVGFFAVKNRFFRLLALAAILASFIGVIFTFSRGAWLCMTLASVFLAAFFIKKREVTPQSWLIGGLVLMVFAIALGAVIQPIMDRLTKGDDGATDSRIRMITLARDLWLEHPVIGVGPSEYPEAGLDLYPPGFKETEWVPFGEKAIVPPLGRVELARSSVPGLPDLIVPLPVHNKYFLTLSELGIVGLLIWLLIFYEFYKDARICAQSGDSLLRFVGRAGLSIVLVATVYMNLDLFADDKTLQILLFPLLVIGASSKISLQNEYADKPFN